MAIFHPQAQKRPSCLFHRNSSSRKARKTRKKNKEAIKELRRRKKQNTEEKRVNGS
jgi:hypothetical protein